MLLNAYGYREESHRDRFVAMLSRVVGSNTLLGGSEIDAAFQGAVGEASSVGVELRDTRFRIWSSDVSRIARDESGHTAVLLYGRLYNCGPEGQAAWCLREYGRQGLSFARELNGSFVIVIADARNDRIAVITDRLNALRAFVSEHKGTTWVSNCLHRHPLPDVKLDLTGLAWVLANRATYNYRTLFEGVRIFERSSIHEFSPQGFRSTPYWSYRFPASYPARSLASMKAELGELLVESVRKRLPVKSPPIVSLSGGYDVSGVLGILKFKLGVPEAFCFSFCATDTPLPGSDADVSRQMCERAGYTHRAIRSYNGDIMQWIENVGSVTQGISNLAGQFDAMAQLAEETRDFAEPVMFRGDMSFVSAHFKIRRREDLLDVFQMFDLSCAPELISLFDETMHRRLVDGVNADRAAILHRLADINIRDLNDVLFIDQRLHSFLLTQTEYFQSDFMPVVNPFHDNAILDFTMAMPSPLRSEKNLYKATITELAPEVFAIPRATSGEFGTDWRKEFRARKAEIEHWLREQPSILDDIVPPEKIMSLLEQEDIYSPRDSTIDNLANLSGCVYRKLTGALSPPPIFGADRVLLFRRLVGIRSFLLKTADLRIPRFGDCRLPGSVTSSQLGIRQKPADGGEIGFGFIGGDAV